MKKASKVSIIVPCYNVPDEILARSLASVRSQTVQDFEVIVIDDGSETPYSESLARICRFEPKTHLIRIPHKGVSSARNIGMSLARGEYIAFLDADDVLAADFLERALSAVDETGADFVIGGLEEVEEAIVPYSPPRPGKPQHQIFTGEELQQTVGVFLIGLRARIVFPDGYIGRGPVSRLVRTKLAQRVPFDPDLTFGEDLIWNLQLLMECRQVCLVRESWYAYWQNPYSVVHRYQPALIDEYRKQIEKLTGLVDTTDDRMYASYADQIYEGLRLFWFRYLAYERTENPDNYRKTVYRIYTEWPWMEIGTKRYFLLVENTKKITALLYRCRLFYAAMAWKERVRSSDVCGGK